MKKKKSGLAITITNQHRFI